jgi:hypothetical protein
MKNTVYLNRVWLAEQVKEHSPVADPKTAPPKVAAAKISRQLVGSRGNDRYRAKSQLLFADR